MAKMIRSYSSTSVRATKERKPCESHMEWSNDASAATPQTLYSLTVEKYGNTSCIGLPTCQLLARAMRRATNLDTLHKNAPHYHSKIPFTERSRGDRSTGIMVAAVYKIDARALHRHGWYAQYSAYQDPARVLSTESPHPTSPSKLHKPTFKRRDEINDYLRSVSYTLTHTRADGWMNDSGESGYAAQYRDCSLAPAISYSN